MVEVEGKEVVIQLPLVDDLPAPLIFGASEMEAYTIKLDLARKRLDLSEFTGHMLALRFPQTSKVCRLSVSCETR